jgi:hypothetical protein
VLAPEPADSFEDVAPDPASDGLLLRVEVGAMRTTVASEATY